MAGYRILDSSGEHIRRDIIALGWYYVNEEYI